MINKLVLENLKHRPVRTLLSICAISLEVTMILTLVGVSEGMLQDSQARARGVGADIWVRPPGSSLFSFSSAAMPDKMVDFFASQPHVTLATASVNYGGGISESVSGVDFPRFAAMTGGFRFVSGGGFQKEGDILIDERYATAKNLGVGSILKLWNREWTVRGIFESGKLARLILPIEVVQDLAGAQRKVSQIFLKVDDPKNVDGVVSQLKANPQLANYPIYSIEEWSSLFSVSSLPPLKAFIGVVITLGVVVGFLVVFLSMYTAVLERTREIGILKSLGASRGFVLAMLLRETAILAIAGSACGILVTYGTRWMVNTFAGPGMTQVIVPGWWPWSTLIAVVGAILGTLYPGWKAVSQDALEALSYE